MWKRKILISLFIPLFILLVAGMLAVGRGDRADDVLRVTDGKAISFEGMIEEVKKADIIFIGEVHDIQEHHQMELEVIRAFHESDAPIVVGLEMFRADSQRALDAWVAGTSAVDQFLPVYYDNWRQPWPSYRDIFEYAREHRIPLLGLNVPDDIGETVARRGFDALTAKQKKQLPPEISCDIDATYMDFIKKAYADHSQKAGNKFLNFCEAQMVWDKTMAWHLTKYLDKHRGKIVIVLAGVGHAWKRGIPEQMVRQSQSQYRSKTILPLVPGQIEPESISIRDADYVLLR